MGQNWVWFTVVVLAAVTALYAFIACLCVVLVTLFPARRPARKIPAGAGECSGDPAVEPVRLTCRDGVEIDACFIPPDGAPTDGPPASIIMLHGIRDSKERLLPLAGELAGRGYGVLLLDLRGHGGSGGRMCSYGYHERQEVRAAVDWLTYRCRGPVGLYGLSLGAAIALLAAAEDPRVRAVVAEGSYARLSRIISDYAVRRGALPFTHPAAFYFIEKLGRMRIGDCDPLVAVRRLRIPVLLIHGLRDRHVRADYSRQLAEELDGRCELWLVPGARHSCCREAAGPAYSLRVGTFFDRHLRAAADAASFPR